MSGHQRAKVFAVLAGSLVVGAHAHGQISGLGADGWHTWQVEAVRSAPEMCCFRWRSGTATKKQCDLDGQHGGFSTTDGSKTPDDAVQVFALMRAGEVEDLRTLSASCPVTAKSAIVDLGPVATDDSVAWLERLMESGRDIRSAVITSVAAHRGTRARDLLFTAAEPGNDEDTREDAIFWMGQVRIGESADTLKKYIFADQEPDIREHAAFSYSQSDAPDVTAVLIRQGKDDADPDVRSQAWFWLAQTAAAESEAAIRDALLHDRDDDVREEAVFALSQLPESRAVKALAAILEDRELGMDIREQALFWLAQTGSDEAFATIDRLLSDN